MNRRRTQQSLGFYFGLIILSGQLIAAALFHVGYNVWYLVITAALIFAPLWGPEFVIELFKVIILAFRGIDSDRPKDDDDD